MKQVYTTTLRLNLEKEADREAWEHLRRVDRKQYRSVNSAVIAAVNAYFSRKEQLEADPYLETREKEDAFLEKVMETLQEGLRQPTVPGLVPLLQLLQGAQTVAPAPAKEPEASTNFFRNTASSSSNPVIHSGSVSNAICSPPLCVALV